MDAVGVGQAVVQRSTAAQRPLVLHSRKMVAYRPAVHRDFPCDSLLHPAATSD
eukprot:COSAG06_NODE_13234_length_1279_cov_6.757627_3_plen_52_part_01